MNIRVSKIVFIEFFQQQTQLVTIERRLVKWWVLVLADVYEPHVPIIHQQVYYSIYAEFKQRRLGLNDQDSGVARDSE